MALALATPSVKCPPATPARYIVHLYPDGAGLIQYCRTPYHVRCWGAGRAIPADWIEAPVIPNATYTAEYNCDPEKAIEIAPSPRASAAVTAPSRPPRSPRVARTARRARVPRRPRWPRASRLPRKPREPRTPRAPKKKDPKGDRPYD